MLEQILASSAQSSMLALLVSAPERSFTAKELKGRLRLSQTVAASALSSLAKLGVVKVFTKGSQRYYLISGKHKLVTEMRASLKKGRPYQDELFSAIRGLGQMRAAFLSGIFTGQPQLPVDILLVGKVNLKKLDQFLVACKKLMGQDVNYSIMSPEEFQIRRDTFDRFIKDIFDYRHLVVVDTLARKSPTGSKAKKPDNKKPDKVPSSQQFIVSRF